MATLIGNELYEYLDHLSYELGQRMSEVDSSSFSHTAHSQMDRIVKAEKKFLKDIHSLTSNAKPMLPINLVGFPNIESFSADLEKICELYKAESDRYLDKDDDLALIASQYRKENNFDSVNWDLYASVSKKEWDQKFASRSKDGALKDKISFFVTDNDDSFGLSLMKCYYVKGFDENSQNTPVLIQSGNARYKVAWNKLLTSDVETYHVLREDIVKNETSIVKSKKYYDDIKRKYDFSRNDFFGLGRGKNMLLRWRGERLNYKAFVDSGYSARLSKANSILKTLDEAYAGRIELMDSKNDISRDMLPELLKFTDLLHLDNPGKIRTDYDSVSGKYQPIGHSFNLINSSVYKKSSNHNIGTIDFVAPHNKYYCGSYSCGYTFKKGWISVVINGNAIDNDEQYSRIQQELRRI